MIDFDELDELESRQATLAQGASDAKGFKRADEATPVENQKQDERDKLIREQQEVISALQDKLERLSSHRSRSRSRSTSRSVSTTTTTLRSKHSHRSTSRHQTFFQVASETGTHDRAQSSVAVGDEDVNGELQLRDWVESRVEVYVSKEAEPQRWSDGTRFDEAVDQAEDWVDASSSATGVSLSFSHSALRENPQNVVPSCAPLVQGAASGAASAVAGGAGEASRAPGRSVRASTDSSVGSVTKNSTRGEAAAVHGPCISSATRGSPPEEGSALVCSLNANAAIQTEPETGGLTRSDDRSATGPLAPRTPTDQVGRARIDDTECNTSAMAFSDAAAQAPAHLHGERALVAGRLASASSSSASSTTHKPELMSGSLRAAPTRVLQHHSVLSSTVPHDLIDTGEANKHKVDCAGSAQRKSNLLLNLLSGNPAMLREPHGPPQDIIHHWVETGTYGGSCSRRSVQGSLALSSATVKEAAGAMSSELRVSGMYASHDKRVPQGTISATTTPPDSTAAAKAENTDADTGVAVVSPHHFAATHWRKVNGTWVVEMNTPTFFEDPCNKNIDHAKNAADVGDHLTMSSPQQGNTAGPLSVCLGEAPRLHQTPNALEAEPANGSGWTPYSGDDYIPLGDEEVLGERNGLCDEKELRQGDASGGETLATASVQVDSDMWEVPRRTGTADGRAAAGKPLPKYHSTGLSGQTSSTSSSSAAADAAAELSEPNFSAEPHAVLGGNAHLGCPEVPAVGDMEPPSKAIQVISTSPPATDTQTHNDAPSREFSSSGLDDLLQENGHSPMTSTSTSTDFTLVADMIRPLTEHKAAGGQTEPAAGASFLQHEDAAMELLSTLAKLQPPATHPSSPLRSVEPQTEGTSSSSADLGLGSMSLQDIASAPSSAFLWRSSDSRCQDVQANAPQSSKKQCTVGRDPQGVEPRSPAFPAGAKLPPTTTTTNSHGRPAYRSPHTTRASSVKPSSSKPQVPLTPVPPSTVTASYRGSPPSTHFPIKVPDLILTSPQQRPPNLHGRATGYTTRNRWEASLRQQVHNHHARWDASIHTSSPSHVLKHPPLWGTHSSLARHRLYNRQLLARSQRQHPRQQIATDMSLMQQPTRMFPIFIPYTDKGVAASQATEQGMLLHPKFQQLLYDAPNKPVAQTAEEEDITHPFSSPPAHVATMPNPALGMVFDHGCALYATSRPNIPTTSDEEGGSITEHSPNRSAGVMFKQSLDRCPVSDPLANGPRLDCADAPACFEESHPSASNNAGDQVADVESTSQRFLLGMYAPQAVGPLLREGNVVTRRCENSTLRMSASTATVASDDCMCAQVSTAVSQLQDVVTAASTAITWCQQTEAAASALTCGSSRNLSANNPEHGDRKQALNPFTKRAAVTHSNASTTTDGRSGKAERNLPSHAAETVALSTNASWSSSTTVRSSSIQQTPLDNSCLLKPSTARALPAGALPCASASGLCATSSPTIGDANHSNANHHGAVDHPPHAHAMATSQQRTTASTAEYTAMHGYLEAQQQIPSQVDPGLLLPSKSVVNVGESSHCQSNHCGLQFCDLWKACDEMEEAVSMVSTDIAKTHTLTVKVQGKPGGTDLIHTGGSLDTPNTVGIRSSEVASPQDLPPPHQANGSSIQLRADGYTVHIVHSQGGLSIQPPTNNGAAQSSPPAKPSLSAGSTPTTAAQGAQRSLQIPLPHSTSHPISALSPDFLQQMAAVHHQLIESEQQMRNADRQRPSLYGDGSAVPVPAAFQVAGVTPNLTPGSPELSYWDGVVDGQCAAAANKARRLRSLHSTGRHRHLPPPSGEASVGRCAPWGHSLREGTENVHKGFQDDNSSDDSWSTLSDCKSEGKLRRLESARLLLGLPRSSPSSMEKWQVTKAYLVSPTPLEIEIGLEPSLGQQSDKWSVPLAIYRTPRRKLYSSYLLN